jgi:hypothetical protein
MPSRELVAEKIGRGRLRYRLGMGAVCSEQELEGELQAILRQIDPALDSDTGRLQPGKRITDVRTNLFLTEQDGNGLSHLGGIECAEADSVELERVAAQMGYRVSRV